MNLISNSLKFTAVGHLGIKFYITDPPSVDEIKMRHAEMVDDKPILT